MLDAHLPGWNAQTEYAGEYTHNGTRWGLNFFAIDAADAAAKLESIKANLVLLGPLELRFAAGDTPAHPPAS